MTEPSMSSNNSGSSPSPNGSVDEDVSRKNGLFLRWSRLVKTVQVKESNAGLLRGSIAAPSPEAMREFSKTGPTTKIILDEVSGCAEPGQVLCMMGPSGSGKTSLLNCLSGRTSYESGIITINGQPLTSNAMKKRLMAQIAYVKQNDVFFEHLTVRDQLGYTAFLRLPQAWSKARKLDEVERIIKLLRLNKVADSKISLLSGGEKKRVNIGTELLTDPSCILLDEPTSGLDSTSAVALMQMLQQFARAQSKTVITSIHQPNSALFFSFDKLIMLAEGNVVFFGSPRDSLTYLRNVDLACPDGYNAADHWMDLLVQDTSIEESSRNILERTERTAGENSDGTGRTIVALESLTEDVQTHVDRNSTELVNRNKNAGRIRRDTIKALNLTTRERLVQAWDNELIADQMDVATLDQKEEDAVNNVGSFKKYNTSWGLQYRVLVHRSLKNSRSAIFTPINLIKSAALGVVSGALWFQMDYTESNVFDMSSFFFFTMTYWVFDSMFTALMAFPSEREVILKERSSGSYHLGAYFLAKSTSEMPTRLVLPFIYMIISFWMAGVSNRFGIFVLTTLISLLSVVAGEALGLMIGASIYDMEKAMTVMTVVSLALMLLGGFFVDNVPSWLGWGKFLSPFKYSFDASRQLIFDRNVPCDGSGALESLCGGSSEGSVPPEEVIEFLNIQGSVGFNVGLLLVIGVIPRYIAYLALRSKKEGGR